MLFFLKGIQIIYNLIIILIITTTVILIVSLHEGLSGMSTTMIQQLVKDFKQTLWSTSSPGQNEVSKSNSFLGEQSSRVKRKNSKSETMTIVSHRREEKPSSLLWPTIVFIIMMMIGMEIVNGLTLNHGKKTIHLVTTPNNYISNVTSLLDYVNPFVGTGGKGFGSGTMSPNVQRPFGMIRAGPDTTNMFDINVPFEHPSGFYYYDDYIVAFSHVHLVGAGVPDVGNIGIMPIANVGNRGGSLIYEMITTDKRSSYYDKTSQVARPGYYSVNLDRYRVKVELAAGLYSSIHKYSFLETEEDHYVIIDVAHTIEHGNCKFAQVNVIPTVFKVKIGSELLDAIQVEGYCLNSGKLSGRSFFQDKTEGGVKIHFSALVVAGEKSTIQSYGVWNDKQFLNTQSVNGSIAGAYVKLQSPSTKAMVYIAISFISIEQARVNLKGELFANNGSIASLVTFDQVVQDTQKSWLDQLNKVQIKFGQGQEENAIKFYTAMYQAAAAPTRISEYGGIYRGFDYKIHNLVKDQKAFFTDMRLVFCNYFCMFTLFKQYLGCA